MGLEERGASIPSVFEVSDTWVWMEAPKPALERGKHIILVIGACALS